MPSVVEMSAEEWESLMAEYETRLTTIIIPLDIDPGVARGLLSRIDRFFSEVRLELSKAEGRKERIENIIREWEREKATGSNEMARKREATLAIQNYEMPDGQTVNLYEVHRTLVERTIFLQGIVDILFGKQSRLITITGVLKLENNLLPYSQSEGQ